MKRRIFRYLRRAVLLVLTAACLQVNILAPQVQAVTQADIDALQDDAADLTQQRKELESQLSALADDKSQALARKNLLDSQIAATSAQISNVESQIAQYDALITQTQGELDQAEADEAQQMEVFRQCVRAMEEGGTISYWSVLFNAADFSDLLGRLDAANEIVEFRQGVVDDLRALQVEIAGKKADLETQRAGQQEAKEQLEATRADLETQRTEQENAKAELETTLAELDQQRSEANALVAEIQSNESEYQAALDEIDAEEEAIQAEIVRLSRELAAANGDTNVALGGYIWPVSSRRIISPFGPRNTGIPGASTNHKGVDIGGVGYTTEVHAAKAGTVIVSQRSSSYGEYVVVSHGSCNTTLYAHMSSRSVSVGEYVAQGDVLGITGSTGISSGPHLHFEITENGNRVNPLDYLTGYVQAW